MFATDYLSLPVFTLASLPIFTFVYLCLPMLIRVGL